jgi:hypothetical protein
MPDASVKEAIMVMELLRASSRSYGNIGETRPREDGGKPTVENCEILCWDCYTKTE